MRKRRERPGQTCTFLLAIDYHEALRIDWFDAAIPS
jgi:hypothetical protein